VGISGGRAGEASEDEGKAVMEAMEMRGRVSGIVVLLRVRKSGTAFENANARE
jgi:hypothetical protein